MTKAAIEVADDAPDFVRVARVAIVSDPPHERRRAPAFGRALVLVFLAITIPVETIYTWRQGLIDPYYAVKVAGWVLLSAGVWLLGRRRALGLGLLAAGWGWLAANFWRALADRAGRLAAGQPLRLGSIELWFGAACLVAALVGVISSLRALNERSS